MSSPGNNPIDQAMLDIYSDYLISSFSHTTATGLSALLDNQISYDKITRFLSAREYSSKDLWLLVTKEDKYKGLFKSVESLELKDGEITKCYFKGIEKEILLIKQVFTNHDGSTGILYLATSDTSLDFDQIKSIYQKRWKVEEYHKSIKSNTGLAKSPTKTVLTQSNHFFVSIYAYFKLENLSRSTNLNHFALKSKLYIKALSVSFKELQDLKSQYGAVGCA